MKTFHLNYKSVGAFGGSLVMLALAWNYLTPDQAKAVTAVLTAALAMFNPTPQES